MFQQFGRRAVERAFEVDLEGLGPWKPAVMEVLEFMENDRIGVFNPDDEGAFDAVQDDDGAWLIDAKANLLVSIPEWFCVACQRIRWETEEDAGRAGREAGDVAWYASNAAESLFGLRVELGTPSIFKPVGPAGCTGEIVLTFHAQQLLCSDDPDDHNKFRFIVAHELVHAFKAMRFIVPAFLDWDTYWATALQLGSKADCPAEMLHICGKCLDQYGSDAELQMIEEYWPSGARQWFKAFYGRTRKRRKGERKNKVPSLQACR